MLEKSLLWTFERDGKSSYLFGSIHLQDQRAFVFADQVKPYIEQAEAFACEYNLSEIPQWSMHPSEGASQTPCKELLSEKKHQKISAFLQRSLSKGYESVLDFTPLQAIQIIQFACLEKNYPHHLDQYLWNHAVNQQKRMFGLETFESQWEILQEMERQQTISDFLKVVKKLPQIRRSIRALVELYSEQDIAKLYKKSKKTLGKQRRIMIQDRNITMVDSIMAITESHSVFAAIGAAHLAGKFGLLKLLKEKGVKLVPVGLTPVATSYN